MPTKYTDLVPLRDELAQRLAKVPGFDSVGITKQNGKFALSVFVAEPGFSAASLPLSFSGYPIVKKKASDFFPQ